MRFCARFQIKRPSGESFLSLRVNEKLRHGRVCRNGFGKKSFWLMDVSGLKNLRWRAWSVLRFGYARKTKLGGPIGRPQVLFLFRGKHKRGDRSLRSLVLVKAILL